MNEHIVKVGMADLNVAADPHILTTLGLGSCVGVCIYDPCAKIAGLAHIMLPYSSQNRLDQNPAKYADTGIPLLLEKMISMGAVKTRMIAKLAGGAQMFKFKQENDIIRIGQKNVEACKDMLGRLNIRIVAEDTGGTYGRTIELDAGDGRLFIRSIGYGVKYI